MTVRSPGLDVVVVAYGPLDALHSALAALEGAYPVVIVDNGSSPASAEVARSTGRATWTRVRTSASRRP